MLKAAPSQLAAGCFRRPFAPASDTKLPSDRTRKFWQSDRVVHRTLEHYSAPRSKTLPLATDTESKFETVSYSLFGSLYGCNLISKSVSGLPLDFGSARQRSKAIEEVAYLPAYRQVPATFSAEPDRISDFGIPASGVADASNDKLVVD